MHTDKELLLKFLKCETTPEEEKLLMDRLDEDPSNRKELDTEQLILEIIALSAPEVDKTEKQGTPRRVLRLARISKISIAASIVLILGFGLLLSYYSNEINDLSNQKASIEVPAGQYIMMTLSDGTEVWLDAGAKLEYPSFFLENQRRVKISGQAMFNVKHDNKRPFIVETFAYNIEVLGTKFNVEANETEKYFSTALLEGSIKLTSHTDKDFEIGMSINDELRSKDGKIQLKKIENFDEFLWPEGVICIHNMKFEELMAKFERVYDVQIEIEKQELPDIQINRGKIRVSDGVEHALKILQTSSHFTYEKDIDTGVITIK